MSEWEEFAAYRGIIEDAKREERKRILTMLEEIDPNTNLYGAILAIRNLDG